MDFNALLNTIIMLFITLVVGFVANRLGIFDETMSKKLSRLIVTICQPALIISSLIKLPFTSENLKLGLTTLGIGIVVHLLLSAVAFLICRPFKDIDEQKLIEFSIVFGNVGFIGFPILESLFGSTGLFMGAFFIVSFHLVLWTWGIAIFARKRNDIKLTVKKIFINLGTVPCAIGFLLFVLKSKISEFPVFFTTTLGHLGNMCTPVSMLIIGALIGRRNLVAFFTSWKAYFLSFVKLIVAPLLIGFFIKLLGFNNDMVLFMTAVCSLPTATMVSILAEMYDNKPEFSAQLVGMSSLLSVVSIPAVLKIAEFLISI